MQGWLLQMCRAGTSEVHTQLFFFYNISPKSFCNYFFQIKEKKKRACTDSTEIMELGDPYLTPCALQPWQQGWQRAHQGHVPPLQPHRALACPSRIPTGFPLCTALCGSSFTSCFGDFLNIPPSCNGLKCSVRKPWRIQKSRGHMQISAIILVKLNLWVHIKRKLNQALEWLGKKYTRSWIKVMALHSGDADPFGCPQPRAPSCLCRGTTPYQLRTSEPPAAPPASSCRKHRRPRSITTDVTTGTRERRPANHSAGCGMFN